MTARHYGIDVYLQAAIREFESARPRDFDPATLRRAYRLMVIVRAVMRRHIYIFKQWKVVDVPSDGSIVIELTGPHFRLTLHVYNPVKRTNGSRDETGWILVTKPNDLLASGSFQLTGAWHTLEWLFDAFLPPSKHPKRYEVWR